MTACSQGWALPHERPDAGLRALLGAASRARSEGIFNGTSADGLARMGDLGGDIVLIGFGLNDAVQVIEYKVAIANLRCLRQSFGNWSRLIEMLVPFGSHGPARTYLSGAIAEAAEGAQFVPDVLDGSAQHRMLQMDRLHPSADGAVLLARRLAPDLDHAGATANL